MDYARLKERLAASPFRSRFRLTGPDRAYIAEKGWSVLRTQAGEIIRTRLGPAHPANDGRQTPMRGHPVFKAQHGAAACCRGCLAKWHGIPPGRPLTEKEIDDIADLPVDWLRDKAGDLSAFPRTPDLF